MKAPSRYKEKYMYKIIGAVLLAVVLTGCRDEARETELEKQITDLQSTVATLTTQVTGANTTLDASSAKVIELKTAITDADEKLQKVTASADSWKKSAPQLEGLLADVNTSVANVEAALAEAKKVLQPPVAPAPK
jgi:chromosome segregation ATPase